MVEQGGTSMTIDHWVQQIRGQLAELDTEIPSNILEDIDRLCEIAAASTEGYSFRRGDLERLATAVQEAGDVDRLALILEEATSICGFDYGSIFILRAGNEILFTNRVCTTLPKEWLIRYHDMSYKFSDPVVTHALQHGNSFLFDEIAEPAPFMQKFWPDALAHGIGRDGCCFNYKFGSGNQIAISFNSTKPASLVRNQYEANKMDLRVLGEMMCHAFVTLTGKFIADKSQLSTDELLHLRRLTMAPDEDTFLELISDNSYQGIRNNIYRKLQVGTIAQALMLVSQQHYLDELPFEIDEIAKSYPGPLERSITTLVGEDLMMKRVSGSVHDRRGNLSIID